MGCVTLSSNNYGEVRLSIPLTVIGAGRVGKTLARCLHRQARVTMIDVVTQSSASAHAAVAFIGAGTARSQFDALADATIFMLAVPDDQITLCCEQLVASGKLGPHSVVFHCSGALPSSALLAATKAGAAAASLHPVRSFAQPADVADTFAGTYCGIEGDDAALAVLSPLFETLGGILVPLHSAAKTLYHAAAVFASNYVVTLMATAQDAYVAAGIPADVALKMLTPLTRETVDNVARLGPLNALTGPIARGDVNTVARQQEAVSAWDSQRGLLYHHLANATRRLAAAPNINTTVVPAHPS